MTTPCPACGARPPDRSRLRAMAAALAGDDLDAALELGLMELPDCEDCLRASGLTVDGIAALRAARDARLLAWAARERHHARAERLQQRAQARREASAAPSVPDPEAPALPASAADALARALAKARAR